MKANKLFLNVALFSILVIVIGIGIYKYRQENFISIADMTLDQLKEELDNWYTIKQDLKNGIVDLTRGGSFQQETFNDMKERLKEVNSELLALEAEIEKRERRGERSSKQIACTTDKCCKNFLRNSGAQFRTANLLDGTCTLSTTEQTGCTSIDAAATESAEEALLAEQRAKAVAELEAKELSDWAALRATLVEGYTLRQIISILELDLNPDTTRLFGPLKDHVKQGDPLPTGYFTDVGSDGLYTLEQIITNLNAVGSVASEEHVINYIENNKAEGIGYTYEQLVLLIDSGNITKSNILSITPPQFKRLDTLNGNVQDGIVMETALVNDGWDVDSTAALTELISKGHLRAQKLKFRIN